MNYTEKYIKRLSISDFRNIVSLWKNGDISTTKCRDMIIDKVMESSEVIVSGEIGIERTMNLPVGNQKKSVCLIQDKCKIIYLGDILTMDQGIKLEGKYIKISVEVKEWNAVVAEVRMWSTKEAVEIAKTGGVVKIVDYCLQENQLLIMKIISGG